MIIADRALEDLAVSMLLPSQASVLARVGSPMKEVHGHVCFHSAHHRNKR